MRLISSGIVRSKLRKPGLDVGDADAEFCGDERAGERRVDVADDDHPIRAFAHENGLEGEHDASRLLGMAAGADLEVEVGTRQAEIAKESVRHRLVVVLPGVDEHLRDFVRALPDLVDERRDLHEVRPRADDVQKLEHQTLITSLWPTTTGGRISWRGGGGTIPLRFSSIFAPEHAAENGETDEDDGAADRHRD